MIGTSALRPLRRAVLVLSTALATFVVAASGQAASYRVYPLPIASPDHGSRVLLTDPHDAQASPFGWHDTNGIPGAEYTTLRGNNVWVYLDQNADNMPDGPGPDGGSGLVFDHPAAPGSVPPISYAQALATNAFYLGNTIHDILWHHGFREADGNFQENNYGNGGLGGDAMRIEIFDGSGTNNANTSTSADGSPPRMQLFVWTSTDPHRETSFDATVVGWAYMEGAQRRLAGIGCAGSVENPTSAYSDWFGTLITNNFAATTPATPRGLGTWLLGQPVSGPGIRTHPYSTDMTTNPVTYADLPGLGLQARGAVYASALWDLTWRLVEREGASGNMVTGNGGENRMLQLVVEALKRQACGGGMVDGRNALLEADLALFDGAYQCDIWQAFARRGLGASAVQGSAGSATDNTAAFDLPNEGPCADRIFSNGFEGEPLEPVWTQFCGAPGIIQLPAGQPGVAVGPASVYPIAINVTGMPASLARVRVQIFGLTHSWPDDVDMLLVGPGGQNLIIQSDVGGSTSVVNLSYVIDDAAATIFLDGGPLTPGSFRPSNVGAGDGFPAPAPATSHNNAAPAGAATLGSVFGGINPNGNWTLYVVDDTDQDSGTLGGVCLEIGSLP